MPHVHVAWKPHLGIDSADSVVFNVGGRHFEVLRPTIDSYPDTLLACLVSDIGTDTAAPIFVDANPDRFTHILDWHRYREMFVPEGPAIQAVLRDARFFLLPDCVTINGIPRSIGTANDTPVRSFEAVMNDVASAWSGFHEYLERIIAKADRTIARAVQLSKVTQHDGVNCHKEDLGTATFHSVRLTEVSHVSNHRQEHRTEHIWNDEKHVCNKIRLQLLMHELAKRGFVCRVEADRDGGLALSMGLGPTTGRIPQSCQEIAHQGGCEYA